MSTVLVTGASSQIGHFLLPRLVAANYQVHAISRQHIIPTMPAIYWHQVNQSETVAAIITRIQPSIWLHVAPIWLLDDWLPQLTSNVPRIIAISSTSAISKQNSSNLYEQTIAKRLLQAEARLAKQTIDWTIFRPTLVYGCGRDQNITTLVQLIRRFKCFPIAGEGKGLRQPIHADDIAMACIDALNTPQTINKIYNLAGASTLTYRQMIVHIFQALHQPPCLLPLPIMLLKLIVRLITIIPKYRHINFNMVNRMNEDLYFDYQAAQQDFNFSPRTFNLDQDNL